MHESNSGRTRLRASSRSRPPRRGAPEAAGSGSGEPLQPPPSILAGLQESGLFSGRGGQRGGGEPQAAPPAAHRRRAARRGR